MAHSPVYSVASSMANNTIPGVLDHRSSGSSNSPPSLPSIHAVFADTDILSSRPNPESPNYQYSHSPSNKRRRSIEDDASDRASRIPRAAYRPSHSPRSSILGTDAAAHTARPVTYERRESYHSGPPPPPIAPASHSPYGHHSRPAGHSHASATLPPSQAPSHYPPPTEPRTAGNYIYPTAAPPYDVRYPAPAPPPPPHHAYPAMQPHHGYMTPHTNYVHPSYPYETYQSTANDMRTRRRRGNLPKETTDKLRGWFMSHLNHPYPSEGEKLELMRATGLQMNQISNWFINARRRQLPGIINSNAEREAQANAATQGTGYHNDQRSSASLSDAGDNNSTYSDGMYKRSSV